MQTDPNAEALRLAEHYRSLYESELMNLAADQDNLTEAARAALAMELANRGLKLPTLEKRPPNERRPVNPATDDSVFNGGAIPGMEAEPFGLGGGLGGHYRFPPVADGKETEAPSQTDYTWKTILCECDEPEQAYALRIVLAKAGIESWVEGDRGGLGLSYPRVVVAADELEDARALAEQPIPQEVFDQLREQAEAPEFDLGDCPACYAPDPVLEDVEPTNQWLCESCGHRWSDPADLADQA